MKSYLDISQFQFYMDVIGSKDGMQKKSNAIHI